MASSEKAPHQTETDTETKAEGEKRRKKSRRVPAKKVSRACVNCRNAHITCDDSRPCKRCVKKGLQHSCVDAPRKVKKYLLGGDAPEKTHAGQAGVAADHVHVDHVHNHNHNHDHNHNHNHDHGASTHKMSVSVSMPATVNMTGPEMRSPSYVPARPHSQVQPHLYGSQTKSDPHQSVPGYMDLGTGRNVGVALGTNMDMNMGISHTGMNMSMDTNPMNSKSLMRSLNYLALSNANHNSQSPDTPPPRRMDFSTMSSGFIRRSPSHSFHLNGSNHSNIMYDSIDGTMGSPNRNDQAEINFLSSAADSEYAILGNIIDQTMFQNNGNNHNSTSTSNSQKYVSPALSTTSEDFEYLNYQPLMAQNNGHSPMSIGNTRSGMRIDETPKSPFVKPLQPIEMMLPGKSAEQELKLEEEGSEDSYSDDGNYDASGGGEGRRKRKLKYSDLYPDKPQCDTSTNQYFIGTMSTIDGVKTHTFPEVVKQIAKFKNEHPKKFRERNRRSAISFSIGILDEVVPEIEGTETTNEEDERRKQQLQLQESNEDGVNKDDEEKRVAAAADASNGNGAGNNGAKCGLLYHEPCEIYAKVKQPFTYVKPYHDLNLYLKSRFPKKDLVQMSKSIAEYRPSFIAGMIKLKEDDLIFAEQCFQRTLLEYDGYIGISGTPTLVWRRSSQIAYVGDEFCILTGWSKENLLGKSTFAVEIMDDRSCVEYFKIFSKIAFGDMSGDTITECTLLTPKGESIRTNSTWTLKRDVFGIPMMIIATFLPILT